ncbi:MAG: hypothetical protein ACRD0W_23085, partial [Acidimicrobiales bacterium]
MTEPVAGTHRGTTDSSWREVWRSGADLLREAPDEGEGGVGDFAPLLRDGFDDFADPAGLD